MSCQYYCRIWKKERIFHGKQKLWNGCTKHPTKQKEKKVHILIHEKKVHPPQKKCLQYFSSCVLDVIEENENRGKQKMNEEQKEMLRKMWESNDAITFLLNDKHCSPERVKDLSYTLKSNNDKLKKLLLEIS